MAPFRGSSKVAVAEWREIGPGDYPRWAPDWTLFYLAEDRTKTTLMRQALTRSGTKQGPARPFHTFPDNLPSPRWLPGGWFRLAIARDRIVFPVAYRETRVSTAETKYARTLSPFSPGSPIKKVGDTLMSKMKLLLFAVLGGTAQASLLINGSFEAVDASAPPFEVRTPSNTPGWTHTGDGVDLYHNNYTQPPAIAVLVDASHGVQFLDMNQAGLLGGIEQVVAATSGDLYRLRLDSTAWAINSIGGTIRYELFNPGNNAVLAFGTFTDNTGGTWTTRELQANAISSQIGVRIFGTVATQAGMGVDNVILDNLSASPVPEPGYALPLAAAGLAAFIRQRRRS